MKGSSARTSLLLTTFSAIAVVSTSVAFGENVTIEYHLPKEVIELMDQNINPCDDFYQFACGGWLKKTKLPSDKTYIGYSFDGIDERNRVTLVDIMENGKKPLVGEMYSSCMNTKAINTLGASVLFPVLNQIEEMTTKEELFFFAGTLSKYGPNFFNGMGIGADAKDATKNAVYSSQPSLSLPDQIYYLDQDQFKENEQGFRFYVNNVFKEAGLSSQYTDKDVVELEKQMASFLASKEDLYDPIKSYNPLTFKEAAIKYPLVFGEYAKGFGLLENSLFKENDQVIFSGLDYFEQAEEMVQKLSLETLKGFLSYQYIDSIGWTLSEPFLVSRFNFYSKQLNGQQERTPRQKTCVYRTTQILPDQVGKEFALQKLDAIGETSAKEMVRLIEQVMEKRMNALEWLDEETRTAAKAKLHLVSNLIGYSDKEENFTFQFKADTLFENVQAMQEYGFAKSLEKIGKPVDRTEWHMSGADVNAYYSPSENQIVFPAAILQFPFFSAKSHPAQNFGAIGAIVGHELTHGFDSNGRMYNGEGNLSPWWTEKTNGEYEARATCFIKQYSSFQVPSTNPNNSPVANVNGNFTLTENIADNGGVNLAFDALQLYLKTNGASKSTTTTTTTTTSTTNLRGNCEDAGADGSSGSGNSGSNEGEIDAEKTFFLAFAQSWCEKGTDQHWLSQISSDPHSPGVFRANGVIMNNHHFGRVFNCPVGSKMNPQEKCEIW